jgi:hypothetical protein
LIPIGVGFILPILLFSVIALYNRSEIQRLPTTPITPAPGSVIFYDDFSNAGVPWWGALETTYVYEVGYVSGEFKIAVYKPDMVVWRLCLTEPARVEAHPARLRLADAEIEVEARQVEGSLLGGFGPVLRSQLNKDGFYWFGISGDGYYWVDLLESGEWIHLVTAEVSDAIHQGLNATNRLRIVCEGERFDFYVNDVLLTSLSDDAFEAGFFGLAVGGGEPDVVVHFDNLEVRALSQ